MDSAVDAKATPFAPERCAAAKPDHRALRFRGGIIHGASRLVWLLLHCLLLDALQGARPARLRWQF